MSKVERRNHALNKLVRPMVENYRLRFEQGERFALFKAIWWCAKYNLPPPGWAATAFTQGCDEIMKYEARSLDEAFGEPIKKGAKIAALKRKKELRFAVIEYIIRNSNRPKDDIIFEEAGIEFGIGKRLRKNIITASKNQLHR
jgi:hypothetical protein